MWMAFIIILFGYFFGSIPTAQIAARWSKGMDLRLYGSGTVSGSMVYEHVNHWLVVPVGLFDIFKGMLPTWIAAGSGVGDGAAVAAGLAAVVGHNWPVFLNFSGGRGLSPFLGLLLVLFPIGVPWLLSFLAVGYLLKDSAPWALAGLVLLPALIYWSGGSAALYWAALGMLLLTLIKRVEANRRPLPQDAKLRQQVILRRIFYDRDIADHADWIRRRPTQS
jgi:glycerol-3-phosphate acyltransferase PlsY